MGQPHILYETRPLANVKTINITITWSSPYSQNTMNLEYYKADL